MPPFHPTRSAHARTLVAAPAGQPARASVCHATVRQGRAEHEWLQPERRPASRHDCRDARVIVAPDGCRASADGDAIEVDLLVARTAPGAVLDVLHRLPEGSWILVTDSDGESIAPVAREGDEHRMVVVLPEGPVRVSARLGGGARLSVRLATAGR